MLTELRILTTVHYQRNIIELTEMLHDKQNIYLVMDIAEHGDLLNFMGNCSDFRLLK